MTNAVLRSLPSLRSQSIMLLAGSLAFIPTYGIAADPSLDGSEECVAPATGGNGCVRAPTFEEQTANATPEQLAQLQGKLELLEALRTESPLGGGGIYRADYPTQPQHRDYYCGPATAAMILSHWGWNPNPGRLHMTQEMLARDESPWANPPLNTTPEGGTQRWSFPPTLNAYVGDTLHGGNNYVWQDLSLDPTDGYSAGKADLWWKTVIDMAYFSPGFPTGYGIMTGPLEGYPQGNLDHYFPGRSVNTATRQIEITDPWLSYVYGEDSRWYRSDNVWEAVHASVARDQILW